MKKIQQNKFTRLLDKIKNQIKNYWLKVNGNSDRGCQQVKTDDFLNDNNFLLTYSILKIKDKSLTHFIANHCLLFHKGEGYFKGGKYFKKSTFNYMCPKEPEYTEMYIKDQDYGITDYKFINRFEFYKSIEDYELKIEITGYILDGCTDIYFEVIEVDDKILIITNEDNLINDSCKSFFNIKKNVKKSLYFIIKDFIKENNN